jgi:hypothetical protein
MTLHVSVEKALQGECFVAEATFKPSRVVLTPQRRQFLNI